MIRYTKHIGLTLLLVFTGSLTGSAAMSAYNLYQLSDKAGYEVAWSSHCKKDLSASPDVDSKSGHFHLSNLPESDNTDAENGRVIINSCSSLHLMLTGQVSLTPPLSETTYSNTISLTASQLFVDGIADPPRKV